MNRRNLKPYAIIPQEEAGYNLNIERSYFALVLPEDSINLVLNPECVDTLGYSGLSATLASTAATQRRGARSILVTPTGVGGVMYTLPAALTLNRHYTFSVDVRLGGRMAMYFATDAGVQVGPATLFDATDFWNRPSVTMLVQTNDVAAVVIKSLDAAQFYVDGFQVERKPYATTFISGNIEAAADTATPGRLTYGWMGPTHRSASYRTRFVMDGGRPTPLSELGLEVTDFSGFGLAAPELITTQLAMRPDRIYQGVGLGERQFTIGGYIQGDRLLDVLRKRGFIGLNSYGTSAAPSPIVVQFQLFDGEQPVTEVVEVECMYAGGLEGMITNLYQEKVTITFRTLRPFLRTLGNRAAVLNTTTTTNDSPITVIYPDGTIEGLPADGYSWADDEMPARMAVGVDGMLYVALAHRLLRYGREGSIVVASANSGNGLIKDVLSGPDGNIYFISEDSDDGGLTGHLARYSPLTGAVDTMNDVVFSVSAGDLIMSRLRYDGTLNRLYVCGNYTSLEVGGQAVAGTYGEFGGICYLNLGTGVWGDFPALSQTGTITVWDVALRNGEPWPVGQFMSAGTHPVLGQPWGWARWEGSGWSGGYLPFVSDLDLPTDASKLGLRTAVYNPRDGLIYVAGKFDRFLRWDSGLNSLMPIMVGMGAAAIDPLSMWVYRVGYGTDWYPQAGVDRYAQLGQPFTADVTLSADGRYAYYAGAFDSVVNLRAGSSPIYAPVPGQMIYITSLGFAVYDTVNGIWVNPPAYMSDLYFGAIHYPAYAGAVAVSGGTQLVNAYDPIVPPEFTEWYGEVNADSIVSNTGAIYVSHSDTSPITASPYTEITVSQGSRAVPRIEIKGPTTLRKLINATTGRTLLPALTANDGEVIVMSLAPGSIWIRSTTRPVVEYANLGKDSFPDMGLIPGKNRLVLDADVGGSIVIYWAEEFQSVEAAIVRYASW